MGEKIFQVCLAKTNDTGEALYTELDLPARPWALLDALDKVRYGSELMRENNSVQTDYGLLERRDGQPIQAMEKPHLEIGGMNR